MKTQEEIEQIAKSKFITNKNISLSQSNKTMCRRSAFVKGYTQCQEDMLNLMDDYQTWIFKTSGPLKSFKQWVDESLNKQD